MWQGQFNTSLLTVQMQIQYHCGHKVQDSENVAEHLKAIAGGMEENSHASTTRFSLQITGSWKNLSVMTFYHSNQGCSYLNILSNTQLMRNFCSESVVHGQGGSVHWNSASSMHLTKRGREEPEDGEMVVSLYSHS